MKVKNITDTSQRTLRIADLQGRTSYHLVLRAYTSGGLGPGKSMFVVTKENCESCSPGTPPLAEVHGVRSSFCLRRHPLF